MKSLIVLEKALLEDSATDVREYLSEIDRKTANECFRLLGEHLGLATMEIGGYPIRSFVGCIPTFRVYRPILTGTIAKSIPNYDP